MPENVSIELRCSKSSDGKFTARTFVNGKELKGKEFFLNRSDEFAVVQLYQRIKKQYAEGELVVKGLDKHAMESILRFAVPAEKL